MTKFKPGISGNPAGKVPGTKNRIPSETREAVKTFIDGHWQDFEEAWQRLRPEKRVRYFIHLLRYAVPVAREIDLSLTMKQLTDSQIDEIVEKILKNGS